MASIRGCMKTLNLMDKNVVREWWLCFQKVALSGASHSLTDILIKEVSLRAIWGWIQYSHSFTHQYCLCLRCHTQWMPKANTFYWLDVCLQITAKYFLLTFSWAGKSGELLASWTVLNAVISQHFFPACLLSCRWIWHIRSRRYGRLLKADNRKRPGWSAR